MAAGETLRRTFSTETITRAGKDEKLMVATGTMTITCADNPALEKRFMDEHARHARTTVIVGPLTGARVVTASEANDDTGPSRTMDCLLKSGALLVRVQASIHARGYRVTDDQGRLIADGTPAAEAAIERLSANLDSLLGSLRLTMGPIEAKTK
ncbi:MAG: hypothetical protein BWY76_01521 [bacterium ADurb.Bin429]|nr:MAG: hypothetical protein BWY76_01521 [bacterium ADurb.Bin429]